MRAKFSWPSTGRRIGPSTTRPVLQAEPANLAGRDVDVFRRGEVVVGHAAQEAVAVGQHFEGAGAADDHAALDLPAHDAHDELAAVHAGVFGDALALGQRRTAWAWAGDTDRPGAWRWRQRAVQRLLWLRSWGLGPKAGAKRLRLAVCAGPGGGSHCPTRRRYGRRPCVIPPRKENTVTAPPSRAEQRLARGVQANEDVMQQPPSEDAPKNVS